MAINQNRLIVGYSMIFFCSYCSSFKDLLFFCSLPALYPNLNLPNMRAPITKLSRHNCIYLSQKMTGLGSNWLQLLLFKQISHGPLCVCLCACELNSAVVDWIDSVDERVVLVVPAQHPRQSRILAFVSVPQILPPERARSSRVLEMFGRVFENAENSRTWSC